jgi:hypothetical protein
MKNLSIIKFSKNKKITIYNPNSLAIPQPKQNKIEKPKKKKSLSIIIK